MISVETARSQIVAAAAPLPAEQVALSQARGRVLAGDLAARVNHPPLAVSSMDGWAIRAADCQAAPATLAIIGESAAGKPFDGNVGPGQAVRIFTGAPMPAGADAVVRQEDAERRGGEVVVGTAVPPGKYVRTPGLDFAVGDVLLRSGTVLGPRQIGLAAAMNLVWLPVRRRPRVAILSTGDEIRMPGEPLGEAQIPGSNGPALVALIEAHGGEAVDLGIAQDSRQSISALLAGAAGVDLLVTSGGASVGDYDLVQDALAESGFILDFWKIAMRPGKPLMFGRLRDIPVLGLPGNPVSALVAALLFLVPMLRGFQGLPTDPPLATARLGCALPANGEREAFLRGSLAFDADGMGVATPFDKQDSAVLSGMSAADVLIIRPVDAPAAEAGDKVRILPLESWA